MSKARSRTSEKPKQPARPQGLLAPAGPKFTRRAEIGILCAILILATALRLSDRAESPPGLNQDEAANGWNAWCLLKTGKDQAGVSWPLFYLRALGSNYTPLNIYLLLPVQAAGGMNVWTTRATASLGGILTVFLIWFVGRRLLGRAAGLLAAGMLAVNPWHLFASRWGIEANLCPLLALTPLALLLAARLPPGLATGRPPRIVLAAVGGILTGLCFYGYPAILIFLPVFLLAVVGVSWRQWRYCLRTRRGAVAAVVFVVLAAAIFAPLAWQHLFHGQEIRKRAEGTWIWEAPGSRGRGGSLGQKAGAVAGRYLEHFGLDFLFLRGDHSSIQSPPGMGMFHWYMLPLMLGGIVWGVKNFRASPAARVILAWVVLYPAGDCLAWHTGDDGGISLHSLRSSPGICGLVLLAAAGGAFAGSWLLHRSRQGFWAAGVALALAAAALNVTYLTRFFGEYNRRPLIYHRYHADLVEACRWLRDRLDQYDAVYCTTILMNQPYIITLHETGYDPRRWQADEKVIDSSGMFDRVLRYGKMHFLHESAQFRPDPRCGLEGLASGGGGKPGKALFILRRIPACDGMVRGPDGRAIDLDEEPILRRLIGLKSWNVVHDIRRPDGEVVLKLVEGSS